MFFNTIFDMRSKNFNECIFLCNLGDYSYNYRIIFNPDVSFFPIPLTDNLGQAYYFVMLQFSFSTWSHFKGKSRVQKFIL